LSPLRLAVVPVVELEPVPYVVPEVPVVPDVPDVSVAPGVDCDPLVLSYVPVEPLVLPDWVRRDVSLLPVAPELVLPAPLVCATTVAAPSNRTIVDANNVRRG